MVAADARPSATLLLVSLALLAGIQFLALRRERPPSALGTDAPVEVFSAERAIETLGRLLEGTGPRPTGSAAHGIVRERILTRLRELGYAPEEQVAFACGPYSSCSTANNVLARLDSRPEAVASERVLPALLLVAHYDSVAVSPGVGDDGSGVAILLEIARALKSGPALGRPVVFLFTDDEEAGLTGAVAFCERHPWAQEVAAVINLEARGTRGISRMFQIAGDGFWMDLCARALVRPSCTSISEEVYARMRHDTDLTVFDAHGFRGLNFAFIGGEGCYHTPLDDFAHLEAGSVQHQGANALALLRELGEADLEGRRPRSGAYADLLGYALLHFPIGFLRALVVGASLLLGWSVARSLRAGRARRGGLIFGLVAFTVVTLAPGILGRAMTAIAGILADPSHPMTVQPELMRLALWSGSLFCLFFLGQRFALRAETWSLALGILGGWAALGLISVFWFPGAGYLFALPLGIAALGLLTLPSVPGRLSSARCMLLCSLPAIVAGLFWLPALNASQLAFPHPVLADTWVPAGCLATLLLPLFAGLPRALSATLTFAAGALALVATVSAASLPAFGPDRPRTLNLYYHLDADRNEARWIASATDGPLPRELAEAFDEAAQSPFPWRPPGSRAFLSEALPEELPPPVFETTGTSLAPAHTRGTEQSQESGQDPEAEWRTVRGRLRSERAASMLQILVPLDAGLVSVVAKDQTLACNSRRVQRRNPEHEAYTFYDLGPEGIEIKLEFDHTRPVRVLLVDVTHGLPERGAQLLSAREQSAVPIGDGDTTVVSVEREL